MSTTSARAARRERQAAGALGVERVRRGIGESAPDLTPIRLPTGQVLVAEVKSRVRLPRIVRAALEQAAGYARGRGLPLAVIFGFGEVGIVSMWLKDFAGLVGLEPSTLPRARPLKRDPRQVEMFGETAPSSQP